MTISRTALAALALAFAVTIPGAIAAETPTGNSAIIKPVKVKKQKMTPAEQEAKKVKSKACSAQADAQNLHGKPRKAFRKACLKKAA